MSASKAPSPTKGAAETYGLSKTEIRLAAIAFKHTRAVPDIDFDTFAAEYGYKDANMARSKYRLALNKHSKPVSGDNNGDVAKASTETNDCAETKPKATPRKRKSANDDADGENKPKATPRKRKAAEGDDDGETKASPAKRGRKPAIKDADGEGKSTPAKRGRQPKSAATVKEESAEKTTVNEDTPAAVVKQDDSKTDLKEAKVELGEELSEEAEDEAAGDEGIHESGELVDEEA
ncbi:Tubby- protein 1 [Trapelia coarctata]|nr:Tubby- protein 1 [Trapelia coarctata]